MKIKQISVSGLFGIFDHVIPLNLDDRITIIHGPNGFGKTAILRLLNGFFNSRYSVFYYIPFKSFQIEFYNGSQITIVTEDKDVENFNPENEFTISYKHDPEDKILSSSSTEGTSPFNIEDDIDLSSEVIWILEKDIPGLKIIDAKTWIYYPTDEKMNFSTVIDRFANVLPKKIRKLRGEPEWLESFATAIHVRLIESQRLLNISPRDSSTTFLEESSMLPTVSGYSDELAKLMRDRFAEYGVTAQSLDRTFPTRLVKQQALPHLTDEQLRSQLDELEQTRSRLIEVGLLDQNENSDFQIPSQSIDENTKNILSVYIGDIERKLSVFDEISNKIHLLRKIINNKFSYSYKEMNFNKEKGFIFKTLYDSPASTSGVLSPKNLSSGEQHELVLLYELLFKVQPNSLVLIDEPELSLHVGWQAQFLKDLQEITELADLDILMATHSPDIIQDRWDLTVELKGPAK